MIRYFLVRPSREAHCFWLISCSGCSPPARPADRTRSGMLSTCCSLFLTVVMLLAIHSIVYTYFMATGKWAKEVVRVYQLPEGGSSPRRRATSGVRSGSSWGP